jgi:CRP/FNR family transcriptional regulator, cyclic AMP receptor protein
MIYIHTGTVRLLERDTVLGAGALLGEIGLLAADKKRTLSVRCETDCALYTMNAEQMAALYFQNPALGFHVMRLVVARLQRDLERSHADSAPRASMASADTAARPAA